MPFKDRLKQLRYMREYASKRQAISLALKHDRDAEKLLWKTVLPLFREQVKMRCKLPVSVYVPCDECDKLEGYFICELFKVQDISRFNLSLELAVTRFCEREDDYLKDKEEIRLIKDVQVSLLNKNYGIIWEILR